MIPLKILFINYEYPPLGGGGGHACSQIARQLAAMGHDVSVMTSRFKGFSSFEIENGVRLHRIPTIRRHLEKCSVFEMMVFLVMSLFYAPFLCRREKPDVVIAFFSIPCGPAALLLNLLFKIPYIVALRGGDVPGFLPEQLSFYHRMTSPLTSWIWRRAAALTANSKGLAGLAEKFSSKAHVHVIPNGVEEVFFYERSAIERSQDVLHVLSVGRLSEQKKVDRQISVFGRLFQQGKRSIHLNIVGDGPLRADLERQAKELGVFGETVFFHGWCDRSRIAAQYRAADIFMLTSDFEGMPNVVLEAMAASLAVVATDAPGTVELVRHGENGFLVLREKLEDFDRIFCELANDKSTLLRQQQHSHDLAKSYTWWGVSQSYADLTNAVLNTTKKT